uniref:SXI2 n=1 Tax=Cryptococcus neoformans TaxID=5207 RepID=Q5NKM6_CRYNE|nr:SXI2 [Cryptococcus neoformans var. grubii]
MGSNLGIDAMIATADRILSELPPKLSRCAMPLSLTGRCPNLDTQPIAGLLEEVQTVQLPSTTRGAIEKAVSNAVNILCSDTHSTFTATISRLASQEATGQLSDKDMEERICVIFEKDFKEKLNKLVSSLTTVIRKRYPPYARPGIKRPSPFAPGTLHVLESAYSRCTILSAAETALIAEAASITPQQVRTWFQNKRNRGKKTRITSTATQHVSQSRPLASLPNRVQRKPTSEVFHVPELPRHQSPPPPLPPPYQERIFKALPRRARRSVNEVNNQHAAFTANSQGGSSFTPSSSTLSISSTDSLPSNGGFIAPFDMHLATGQLQTQVDTTWGRDDGNAPADVFNSGAPVSFNFIPPTPLNTSFDSVINPHDVHGLQCEVTHSVGNGYQVQEREADIVAGINFGELDLGLVNTNDFVGALKEFTAFEGLTLAGSPQFTASHATSPSEAGVSDDHSNIVTASFGFLPFKPLQGSDTDFFTVIDHLLSASSISSPAQNCTPEHPASFNSMANSPLGNLHTTHNQFKAPSAYGHQGSAVSYPSSLDVGVNGSIPFPVSCVSSDKDETWSWLGQNIQSEGMGTQDAGQQQGETQGGETQAGEGQSEWSWLSEFLAFDCSDFSVTHTTSSHIGVPSIPLANNNIACEAPSFPSGPSIFTATSALASV